MEDSNFTYTAFDRQVVNLLTMAGAVISGWDDYGSMEMNLDLRSLRIKAAKVCFMADEDHALQTDNIVRERAVANGRLFAMVNGFMEKQMSPFMNNVADKLQRGGGMQGASHGMFRHSISAILPRIAGLLDSTDTDNILNIIDTTNKVEKIMSRKKKPTQQGMTDLERFWTLYELYALMSYLQLHFRNVHMMTSGEPDPDDIGRLLQATIFQYAQTEEGQTVLTRHLEALRFDHGGELAPEVLQSARTALRKEVPDSLQLCFMRHINDIDALGRSLLEVKEKSADDVKMFVITVAKWQMLTNVLEGMKHPRADADDLPNSVFHDMLHDKRISMKTLRSRIERMLPYITRKNHWFCLWSVLRYHNMLKDTNAEAFARQMLSPEWFGNRRGITTFNGDTLREYTGYFTDRNFRMWDEDSYEIYCKSYNKKKWSPTLCTRFQHICYQMNEAFIS